MNQIREWLANGPLLADGAWGTELHRLGLAAGESADAWNLSHPDRVEAVARSYVEAGSRIILTNTFQANAGQVRELNTAGVRISKRAAGGAAKVVASIGPGGDEAAVLKQSEALAGAGADALLLETFVDVAEARTAVAAAKRTGLPVIVSFVFLSDFTPEQVASAMNDAGADAVGANCGTGLDGFCGICARLRAACDLPLWIKPSAGLPGNRVTPEDFAAAAMDLIAAGADIIGGCCGTTPKFIEKINAKISL